MDVVYDFRVDGHLLSVIANKIVALEPTKV